MVTYVLLVSCCVLLCAITLIHKIITKGTIKKYKDSRIFSKGWCTFRAKVESDGRVSLIGPCGGKVHEVEDILSLEVWLKQAEKDKMARNKVKNNVCYNRLATKEDVRNYNLAKKKLWKLKVSGT